MHVMVAAPHLSKPEHSNIEAGYNTSRQILLSGKGMVLYSTLLITP